MNPIDVLRWAQEIRELKARYFRLQDTKCWNDYAGLFLDDSLFDVAEAFTDPDGADGSRLAAAVREPIIGRDAIVAYVSSGLHARVRSFHAGFTPEIEILSESHARGLADGRQGMAAGRPRCPDARLGPLPRNVHAARRALAYPDAEDHPYPAGDRTETNGRHGLTWPRIPTCRRIPGCGPPCKR